MRASFPPWWLLRIVVCAGLASTGAVQAQELTPPQAELAKKFASVTQWQGIWEVSVIGAAARSSEVYQLESRWEAIGSGTFVLERTSDDEDAEHGDFTWEGKGEARGRGFGAFSEWRQRGLGEDWTQEFRGTVPQERIEFRLSLKRKFATLHPGMQRDAAVPQMRRTGRMISAQSGGGTQTTPIATTFPAPVDVWYLGSGNADDARRWQGVANGPGVFTFTHESPTSGRSQNFETSGAGVKQRSRVILFPVYQEFEVEVTIADYATFRPRGSIADPKKPGNSLVARATLKSKTGAARRVPEVKAFRFQLMDTSREPGVCLNWPLGAKDDDYDLRLATAGTGGELSDRDQKLSVAGGPTDTAGRPYAEATIDCFDFGARAGLLVICALADGRELIGLMKNEGAEEDIVRIPKMKGPDWIAESWRKEKKVENLPAMHDDEKVDGQKHNGDGFTLYEEYRGWVVNGKHVEGDPEKKDFFVLNLIGADGQKGIDLFERLSQLRVHSKLRRSEMSQTTRLMNGNHRDAPQRVKQHGVWVKTFTTPGELGGTGAFTPLTKAGVSGRPGITKGIGLLARSDASSDFNKPYNLPRFFALLAYDRAIAHELLHSVGVEHHGEGDWSLGAKWVSPTNKRNKVGRPYFREMLGRDDSVLTLLTEQGHDIAAQYMQSAARDRELTKQFFWDKWIAEGKAYVAAREGMDRTFTTAEDYAEFLLEEFGGMSLFGEVGADGGQHSGGQDCLMRYYFAKFYRATGRDSTFYQVTEGTEPFGMELCRSRDGTGINAPGHRPQSRYGSAASGNGDCFGQICPNDAIPPRKTKS